MRRRESQLDNERMGANRMTNNGNGMHSLYPMLAYNPVIIMAKTTAMGSGLLTATFDGINSRQIPCVSIGWVAPNISFPVLRFSDDSQRKVGIGPGGWVS